MSERTEVITLREKMRTRIVAFNIALQDFIEAVNNYMMAVDKLLASLEKKEAKQEQPQPDKGSAAQLSKRE